jgi:hypothetical protein
MQGIYPPYIKELLMRMILALVGLVVSASAFALPIYNCEVTATPKLGAWREPWTKKLLLSPAFTNRVDFGQTVVELRVNAWRSRSQRSP